MSFKSKIAAVLAVATVAISFAIPTSSAQAGSHGWGIGAAIVGSAIVGGVVANGAYAQPVYVDGYRRCRWERQYNAYGYYVGNVKVCRAY